MSISPHLMVLDRSVLQQPILSVILGRGRRRLEVKEKFIEDKGKKRAREASPHQPTKRVVENEAIKDIY